MRSDEEPASIQEPSSDLAFKDSSKQKQNNKFFSFNKILKIKKIVLCDW